MTNCFEGIRNRLDIRTVVEHYGIEIKRNNTCLCPFHDDHHQSAHIYPNAFHCFTCNIHYDVLGFVMDLFGLTALDAAKKLNDDFQLGIQLGYEKKEYHKPKYSEDAEIREIQRKKRERFEKWENDSWHTINSYLWFVRDWKEKYKPTDINAEFDNRFSYALIHLPHVEEFSYDWITQFNNEEKVGYKWVVDEMKEFLIKYKIEENPQNPESPKAENLHRISG